jgi:hypothetical protein
MKGLDKNDEKDTVDETIQGRNHSLSPVVNRGLHLFPEDYSRQVDEPTRSCEAQCRC